MFLKILISLLSTFVVVSGSDHALHGMVSIERGISPIDVVADGEVDECAFAGTVTLAGPFSLSSKDKFFNIGNKQLTSFQMMVDDINTYRCGVKIQDEQYALRLETYDDHSSKDWTNKIGSYLVNRSDVDIIMGGYSSGLTGGLANIANESSKLLLAPGAASTGVFKDRPLAFGSFPPTAKYTSQAVKGLAGAGAKSIASIWESASFTRGVCAAIPGLADEHGMTVTSTNEVVASPNVTVLQEIADSLKEENPDVVMTCVYDQGCQNWMKAMKAVDWSPRAQVFTVCVGLQSFVDGVGDDATHIMGVTPWDQSLNIIDEVTGWSASDFAERFMKVTGDVDVTYHAASAASVISIAVQAIEQTNSLDSIVLARHISESVFKTAYGSMSFDVNGQSQAPSLLIQYDAEGAVQTVYPEEVGSGPILYPMPTWAERTCIRDSGCQTSGNQCNKQGLCVCSDSEDVSVGSGTTAQCIPKEDFNYVPTSLKIVVYFYVAVAVLFALVAAFWTFTYRNNMLVKISQPLCLGMILIGTLLSTSSLIPMGYETGYRDSSDIGIADATCMIVPWLWGLGFTITFSSLFAKVWRVKKLFKAATHFRRQQVGVSTILWIIVPMIVMNVAILTAFQIISPMYWERKVLEEIDGFAIESEGHCNSEHGWSFWMALVVFNIFSLLVALVLCFQTKDIPSDFAESSHIFLAVMFMFQVMVLAVPVCAMVKDNPDVFFFTRATAVFLQNFTVLVIIFGPKMYRIYKGEDTMATVKKSISLGASKSRRERESVGVSRYSVESLRENVSQHSLGGSSNELITSSTKGAVTFADSSHFELDAASENFLADDVEDGAAVGETEVKGDNDSFALRVDASGGVTKSPLDDNAAF